MDRDLAVKKAISCDVWYIEYIEYILVMLSSAKPAPNCGAGHGISVFHLRA